jgi:hypothetical protein
MMQESKQRNADVAMQRQLWAISALPTFTDGLPATPMISPDVFTQKHAVAPVGNDIRGNVRGSRADGHAVHAGGGSAHDFVADSRNEASRWMGSLSKPGKPFRTN